MGAPIIWSGEKAKVLKAKLQLADQATIMSGAVNPSSVATTGSMGDAYLSTSTGKIYIKQDSGSSTNWTAQDAASGTSAITYTTKSATATLTTGEQGFVNVDATSGTVTINLPTASGNSGLWYMIRKSDGTVNTVVIDPSSTQTINGYTTITLRSNRDVIYITSNGSDWVVISDDRKPNVRSVTADPATVNTEYDTLLCDATAGAFTCTLTAAAAMSGHTLTFIKSDSSANAITIDGNGSETINGATTYSMPNQYNGVTIRSNGTSWNILNEFKLPAVSNLSSDTSLDYRHQTTFTDPSGGNITHTLPTASNYNGWIFSLQKTSKDNNTVTINTTGGALIDGYSSGEVVLRSWRDMITVQSNGTNWIALSARITPGYLLVTTTATLLYTTPVVECTATGNYTITLPTAVGFRGRSFEFKRTDTTDAFTVTIGTTSSQTIDGSTTNTWLSAQYKYLKVTSNGANWMITGQL